MQKTHVRILPKTYRKLLLGKTSLNLPLGGEVVVAVVVATEIRFGAVATIKQTQKTSVTGTEEKMMLLMLLQQHFTQAVASINPTKTTHNRKLAKSAINSLR